MLIGIPLYEYTRVYFDVCQLRDVGVVSRFSVIVSIHICVATEGSEQKSQGSTVLKFKSDHVIPLIKILHWFLIAYRSDSVP